MRGRRTHAVMLVCLAMVLSLAMPEVPRISALTTSVAFADGVRPAWPARGSQTPLVPSLRWATCDADRTLKCASVLVPLDYRYPRASQISIKVAMHPASMPSKKIGALFVNPGGPGDSAIGLMGKFVSVLGPSVTSRFDLIAMDPRGVGQSAPTQCWSRRAEPDQGRIYPISTAEYRVTLAHDNYVRTACAATATPIINHMSTAEAARDMDVLRQALHQKTLSYYGVSYGTYLGATYAALFPSKVRAMIVDGVVDPVAWATGRGVASKVPVSARMGSGAASDATLKTVFAACKTAGARRCPHGSVIASEWTSLLARLRKGGVTRGAQPYDYANEINGVMVDLYDPSLYSTMIASIHTDYLAVVKGVVSDSTAKSLTRVGASRKAAFGPVVAPTKPLPTNVQWWEEFGHVGVMCSDSINPTTEAAWARYGAKVAKSSWFSTLWGWDSSLCAGWPGHDAGAYRGPFSVRPAHPLLVIGNTHDPVTPLSNAVTLSKLSPGARLLTVNAYGHTAADKSACGQRYMRSYLLTGALPPRGTVCQANQPIF